jgi:hypothetical protein
MIDSEEASRIIGAIVRAVEEEGYEGVIARRVANRVREILEAVETD